MPAYERLVGDTFLLRGSPQAVAYLDGDGTLYIIDPGQGSGRVKSLQKLARDLAPKRLVAIVTHFHSDHLEVLARGRPVFDEVHVPEPDAPGVRDPAVRMAMTFGYPLDAGDEEAMGLPFRAPGVEYTHTYKPGGRIGPLETIPLPGHTPGHTGVKTPDGVFYAADAIFGPRVLERYLLPYHRDPCMALETISRIEGLDYEVLVPGHGPRQDRGSASELVEANRRAVESLVESVESLLGETPRTPGEILERLAAGRLDPESKPGLVMLLEQTVRGTLACLARRGRARPAVTPSGVGWVKP